jgi:hypothetical protein
MNTQVLSYRKKIMSKKIALIITAISLLVDFVTVLSVSLNLKWVRTFAAGGQYTTFPGSVRIMYLFQAALVIVIAGFAWKIRNGLTGQSDKNFALVITLIYGISTVSQLISKSPHERWNAIPAALIAWGFYALRRG